MCQTMFLQLNVFYFNIEAPLKRGALPGDKKMKKNLQTTERRFMCLPG